MYDCLESILTVSEADRQRVLLSCPSHTNVNVMGDTRCDSVLERRRTMEIIELPEFAKGKFVFIAGSIWPSDELCIFPGLRETLKSYEDFFVILVPHEPTDLYIKKVENYFLGINSSAWSNITSASQDVRIIVIDSIGILAALYHHAKLAFVGGAFTTGVHNMLEPAAMETPVI